MFFNEGDEIRGRVTGQRGFREVFVRGDKIFRPAMKVGEIAAATAGDQDFLADAIGVLQYGDASAAFAGLDGAEQAGGAGAKNQGVKSVNQVRDSSELRNIVARFPIPFLSRLN
jgi:hypothetical protein